MNEEVEDVKRDKVEWKWITDKNNDFKLRSIHKSRAFHFITGPC